MTDLAHRIEQGVAGVKKVASDTLTGAMVGAFAFGVISLVLTARRLYKGQPVEPRRSES